MTVFTKIASRLFLKRSATRSQDIEDFIGRLPEIMGRDDVIKPGELAVKQKKITGTPMENLPILQKIGMIPFLIANFRQVTRSYDNLNTPHSRDTIDKNELKALEDFAKQNGVIAIGYIRVDPDDILDNLMINKRNQRIFWEIDLLPWLECCWFVWL